MKIELIARVLDGVAGVKKEGQAWVIPDEVEVAAFIALPSEVLTVPRCARVEATGELVSLETHKGDRLWFAIDALVGFKTAAPEKRTSSRGAGFR